MAKSTVHAERAAAVTGAQAVADAVQRVADAAVAEVQKTPSVEPQEVIVLGAGNKFELQGEGFSHNGTVTVNGMQAETTGWGSTRIYGKFPAGAPSEGEIVVHIDDKTSKRGTFKR